MSAMPLILRIKAKMRLAPNQQSYRLESKGVYAGRSSLANDVSRYVEAYFTELGWRAASNRDGDLVVSRPLETT
jgi:hypothetical protein